jgi:hypothetical protein
LGESLNIRRVAVCLVLSLLAACGSSSPNASTAPTILVQPVDQTIAPGQTTTLTVQADAGGTAATYRWYWNGVGITDVTGPTLTTRPAETADDGSTFAVVVTTAVGSVTSRTATLTVSPAPRAPRAGDLRFQGVGAAPFHLSGGTFTAARCLDITGYEGLVGTPLSMTAGSSSPGICGAWFYGTSRLPASVPIRDVQFAGLTGLEWLRPDLDRLGLDRGVITSLDVQEPANQYAYSYVRAPTSGFGQAYHGVAPQDLAALVASEGRSGRVVTAVSFHAGGALAVSYAWSGEPLTAYETAVRGASGTTVGDVASGLAADGYIITALGRDGGGGLVLVGTRVQGDTMARPLVVVTDTGVPRYLLNRGFAIVGVVRDPDSTGWTWIAQQ